MSINLLNGFLSLICYTVSRFIFSTVVIWSITLTAIGAPTNPEAVEVSNAVNDLYRALNERDATVFSQYLMPQGFTEFNPDWPGMRRLNLDKFKSIFESGTQINLRVAELQIQMISTENAVATGYRVGTITDTTGATVTSRLALSMIWTKRQGQWKLQHVHLSEEKEN